MAKKALVILAEGFEEIEALTPVDLLKRAGIDVTVAGVGGTSIKGCHGIEVGCDTDVVHTREMWDCVILPGGMPGSVNLASSFEVLDRAIKADLVCAICAAPAVVLGHTGLLDGRKACCFPGCEDAAPDVDWCTDRVVHDGNVITARAMGCAIEFSLEIIRTLVDGDCADKIRKQILA